MKEAKYTPTQMSLIDYQAMNAGSKKFKSSPYALVHWAKHQGHQWFTEVKANKFDSMILPTCRCCNERKMETIRDIIQCKSRAKIHEKKMQSFTELIRQVEMPNDILKLLEEGIDLILLGRETFRGRRWQDMYLADNRNGFCPIQSTDQAVLGNRVSIDIAHQHLTPFATLETDCKSAFDCCDLNLTVIAHL